MNSKLIPAAVLVAMFAASGAAVVSAQTAPTADETTAPVPETPAADATPAAEGLLERTGFLGGRGDDEGRGERGHGGGHGGHGGGDLVRGILSGADADADGAVTQTEIDAFRAAQVGTADVSGEGDLSLEEFKTVYLELIRSQMVDAFQDLDEDGDASITPVELDARLNGVVEQMDRDGDGALSPADGRDRQG